MLGFSIEKPIIGVVHLKALPGSPCFDSMSSVLSSALKDADELIEGGVDGLIVENFGDKPFTKKIDRMTLSSMSIVVNEISNISNIPIGINVLRNDWESALSITKVLDLDFIRINVFTGVSATSSGLIEGEAAEIQRYRERNDIKTFILADIDVKHGRAIYPKNIGEAAIEASERGLADSLIVTGGRTGESVDVRELDEVKSKVDVPIIIGSGLNLENMNELIPKADGAIVGTYFKEDGDIDNPVSQERVKIFISKMEEMRG